MRACLSPARRALCLSSSFDAFLPLHGCLTPGVAVVLRQQRLASTHASTPAEAAPEPDAAFSLAEAYSLRDTATSLLLSASRDLRCVNIMCEKVGQGCACRVALSLSRMERLQTIDLSNNNLDTSPDALWSRPNAASINLANNKLRVLPDTVGSLTALAALDLRGNRLTSLPLAALSQLRRLTMLRLGGNVGLPPAEIAAAARLVARNLAASRAAGSGSGGGAAPAAGEELAAFLTTSVVEPLLAPPPPAFTAPLAAGRPPLKAPAPPPPPAALLEAWRAAALEGALAGWAEGAATV